MHFDKNGHFVLDVTGKLLRNKNENLTKIFYGYTCSDFCCFLSGLFFLMLGISRICILFIFLDEHSTEELSESEKGEESF